MFYFRFFIFLVWFILFGSLGIMIIFLWVMDKISLIRGLKKLFYLNFVFGFDNVVCFVFVFVFGCLVDELKLKINGVRFVLVVFGMVMLVFVLIYLVNLVVFFIVDDKSFFVEDIYDIKVYFIYN